MTDSTTLTSQGSTSRFSAFVTRERANLLRAHWLELPIADGSLPALFGIVHHAAPAGYIWNGITHQSRTKALAGAMPISSTGSCLQAVIPSFEADKAVLSVPCFA
jgi:hypothetical protein